MEKRTEMDPELILHQQKINLTPFCGARLHRVGVTEVFLGMLYKILADIIVVTHFAWIIFMLVGFIFTLAGFFRKGFFDRWLFRTLHLCGIAYVSSLAILGKYCPLTIWENSLRQKYEPELTYTGSFMIHYVEKLVYPDINPLIIQIPTTFIAVFTILIFLIRPPKKIKRFFPGFFPGFSKTRRR